MPEGQGALLEGVLVLPAPQPLSLVAPGIEPRAQLRYRLVGGETHTWTTRVVQTTYVRNEKVCPAPGAPHQITHGATSTMPVRYTLDLVTRVTAADESRVTLDSSFARVSLSLPPPLTSQEKLIASLLGQASFTTEMTTDGHVRRFKLSQVSGRALWSDLEQLKTPLGHLQPVFPALPVGQGARWRQLRRLPVRETSGELVATYTTEYEVTAIHGAAQPPTIELRTTTDVAIEGKLMTQPYQGRGRIVGRSTLDLRRGLILTASAETNVCTAVMGRSSENQSTYTQTLKPSR
jgi:hypothetical protein